MKNNSEECNVCILYAKAKRWMHMKRTRARMARAEGNKSRRGNEEEEEGYSEQDYSEPYPNEELAGIKHYGCSKWKP